MSDLHGPLAELVRRLDELRSEPSLTKLVETLESAKLTTADVVDFIKETPRSYHRASIVRRKHYELLILTWLPGQGSVPHDHSGSVSALQVIQGDAQEGSWRIAQDGYVDLEYETRVGSGGLTAWQDAGVHSVRNASEDGTPLVTVHVYSPPLKEFRRYVPRPKTAGLVSSAHANETPTVVVVGGGFSGSMSAAQIIRRASLSGTAMRVVLVERQGAVGEGLAYGTRDLSHLLNVPAGKMSAWPDRPNDFVEWASERHGEVRPGEFLPRQWYGEYVRESLLTAANEAGESVSLSVVIDEARRIARRPTCGWMVNFARGASLPADAVVLAIGHRPPPDPIGRLWSGPRSRFIADPWRPFAANNVGPDDPVVVLGSGLTAVDTVLSLSQEPRRAPITLISRHGFFPQAHAESPITPTDLNSLVSDLMAAPGGLRIKTLFQQLRRKVREVIAAGGNWRSVVDGLRPHTANLWRTLPLSERKRFLARLRPYWEVHRHRMALGVAKQFGSLLDQGLVRVIAGRVASAQAEDHSVRLYVRERGDDRLIELNAGWVINCTGPTASNSAESNPAIGSLLVHGWLRPDELALGLETTPEGNAIDAEGDAISDLFVVGTLRKPSLWESTAVPELRTQAASAAECVLNYIRSREPVIHQFPAFAMRDAAQRKVA